MTEVHKVVQVSLVVVDYLKVLAISITIYLLLCLLLLVKPFLFELKYLLKEIGLLLRLIILNNKRWVFSFGLIVLLGYFLFLSISLFLSIYNWLSFLLALRIDLIPILILFHNLIDIFLVFHSDFHFLNRAMVASFIVLAQHLIKRIKSNWNIFVDKSLPLLIFELIFASAQGVEELFPRLRHLIALNGSRHHLAFLEHSGCLCEFSHLKVALTCLSKLVQISKHLCCS